MLREHATFPDGGFDFEAGITEMAQRLADGTLKISAELTDWFQEYRNYHRVNGLVHKIDDDLLSATRVLCMSIRKAKEFMIPNRPGPGNRLAREPQMARNVDFDVFTGQAFE
jgi:hypothetical protein